MGLLNGKVQVTGTPVGISDRENPDFVEPVCSVRKMTPEEIEEMNQKYGPVRKKKAQDKPVKLKVVKEALAALEDTSENKSMKDNVVPMDKPEENVERGADPRHDEKRGRPSKKKAAVVDALKSVEAAVPVSQIADGTGSSRKYVMQIAAKEGLEDRLDIKKRKRVTKTVGVNRAAGKGNYNDAIRIFLGDDGYNAFCRGKALECIASGDRDSLKTAVTYLKAVIDNGEC